MPLDPKFYVPQNAVPSRILRQTWGILVALGLLWALLIIAAPLAQTFEYVGLAEVLYRGFQPVCHQIAERSFHLHGWPFAVCARCTGLYWGLAAGFLAYPLLRPLSRLDTPARGWLLIGLLPVTIDFLLGYMNIWANTHASRFITGGWLGVIIALYLVPGVLDLRLNWRNLRGSPVQSQGVQATIDDAQRIAAAPSDYSAPTRRVEI